MDTTRKKIIADPYSTLALHGVNGARTTERFWEMCLDWWRSLGVSPQRAWLRGSSFSPKTTSFRTAERKLKENGFEELSAFELVVLTDDGNDVIQHGVSSAIIDMTSRSSVVQMSAAMSSLDAPEFCKFATECIATLNAEYGYAFKMPCSAGPGFYAVGINYRAQSRGVAKAEIDRISKWGNAGIPNSVWNQGLLRDVYPLNLLTESHVTRRVGEQTFEDWVAIDAKRGKLTRFSNKWLWAVLEPDVVSIREFLSHAGMLFDYPRSGKGCPESI